MFEILEKFVKKLEKLENYYVLRQEPKFIIIGTKVIIKEHKEVHSTFSTYTSNLDKELPVFFLITDEKKLFEMSKEFIKRKIPVLNLTKIQGSFNVENIRLLLNEFVTENFKY